MGAMQISGCFGSSAAMEAVAASEFEGIVLDGEPEPIGSAGEGNAIDAVLSHYGQNVSQTENDMWEYYKSTVVEGPGSFLKAWLHWNGSEFDAYLRCAQGGESEAGFASHAMPYVQ